MQKLKEILKKLIEQEQKVESITTSGITLEEALQNASQELGVSISELDYEIVEFGNKGFMGVGKKDFVVQVYSSKEQQEVFENVMSMDFEREQGELELADEVVNVDSEAFVRVTSRGVLLKISPPKGKGKKISEKKVVNAIYGRGISEFDQNKINKIMKEAKGEYIRIGEMPINVVNDSTATVQISSDEMKAYTVLTSPKPGGFDLEVDEIKNILNNNGVVVGIKEDIINEFMDYPRYNEPILVAEGLKVKDGKDAFIQYNFNTNKDEIHFVEEDGKVNFKELNLVQNVVAGQILATKQPPTDGEPGRTVTNKLIPAKPGKNTNLLQGRNTKLTEDGTSIVAEINGQVYLMGGKIVVDPVYTIQGDVNLKSGNILFLGTVIVQGNVEDGFSIKAAGNIEVHGSVGKCELDAEGDIIISGGVMGKNEGLITSGKSIYAKFIESVKVEANEGIYVQDGILHAFIDATKEVVCIGKRGAIVGGRVRAGELVKTKSLGSIANPETIIEVGIDPKKRQIMLELEEKREKSYKELEPLKANLENLNNQKKVMKKLPQDKEELFQELLEKTEELETIIKTTDEEITEIETYLSQLKSKGKIIASKVAFPGVKLYIKNAYLGIKTDYKKVAFVLQSGEVNTLPYSEDEVIMDKKDKRK